MSVIFVNTRTKREARCVLFFMILCQLVAQLIAFLKKEKHEGDTSLSHFLLFRYHLSKYSPVFYNQLDVDKASVSVAFISHESWKKLSVKDMFFVLKTVRLSWLCALCPHYETRGTSGVSLFLLNPQGASVYHSPKYEPIFSIILWSPWMSVCRTSLPLHQI